MHLTARSTYSTIELKELGTTHVLQHPDLLAHTLELLVILAFQLTQHRVAVLTSLVWCRRAEVPIGVCGRGCGAAASRVGAERTASSSIAAAAARVGANVAVSSDTSRG